MQAVTVALLQNCISHLARVRADLVSWIEEHEYAGITHDRSLRKLSDDEWRAVLDTNLSSAFYCTAAAMPAMVVGQANYAASKGRLIAFTKTAALELAKFNITVNAVAPGFTQTDMLAKVPDDIKFQLKARIPMGRFGEPEQIARAV